MLTRAAGRAEAGTNYRSASMLHIFRFSANPPLVEGEVLKITSLGSVRALGGRLHIIHRICHYYIPLFGDLPEDGHVGVETCWCTS